jgi:hypothetical protein
LVQDVGGRRKAKLLRPFFVALRKGIGLNSECLAFAIQTLVPSTTTRLTTCEPGGILHEAFHGWSVQCGSAWRCPFTANQDTQQGRGGILWRPPRYSGVQASTWWHVQGQNSWFRWLPMQFYISFWVILGVD